MMNSSNTVYGSLIFFRKDGQPGTSYPLFTGETTIGSSKDADIRLKISDQRLEQMHCIIDVNENGIATLLNKSVTAPVNVNNLPVRKIKVLSHEDKIELIGKNFQYLNDSVSEKDVNIHQKFLNKAISSPMKRRSVAPLMNTNSAKKTPSLRTKSQIQKIPPRKSFAGSSTDVTVSVTPARRLCRSSIGEKPKTTSKIVVSKALGSPRNARRRRLSLDSKRKSYCNSPKVSARNILLSENTVSSTITEEDEPSPKPSVSMKKTPLYKSSQSESGRKTKIYSVASEDLAEDSLLLNLSSNSSEMLSDNLLGGSEESLGSDMPDEQIVIEETSPVKSKLSKSGRESILKTPNKSQADADEESMSNESFNLNLSESDTPNKLETSTRNTSITRDRYLQRRSNNMSNEGLLDEWSSSEELAGTSDTQSGTTAPTISQQNITTNEGITEIQSSSEETLKLNESKLFPRSRRSLRKSNIVQEQDGSSEDSLIQTLNRSIPNLKQARRSSMTKLKRSSRISKNKENEDQSPPREQSLTVPKSPGRTSILKSRVSFRKSPTIRSLNDSQTNRQSLNADVLQTSQSRLGENANKRRSSIKDKSVVSDFQSPNKSLLGSRHSIRKSSGATGDKKITTQDEDIFNLSTADSSKAKTPLKSNMLQGRRSSMRKSNRVNSSNKEPLTNETSKNLASRHSTIKNNNADDNIEKSIYSSEDERVFSSESGDDRDTPIFRHSSLRKSFLSNGLLDGETSEIKDSHTRLLRSSSRGSSVESSPNKANRKTPIKMFKQNISVISLNDSIEGTPENNTSVIILDTPCEKTYKPTKRLSKTLNSTIIEDTELTTPKSAIKSRRSKSLPYNPSTEDITPVTPLNESSKRESSFKTPLNTPGLFEDIKKTVMKSRTRSQQPSSNLMEELSKEEVRKAVKRPKVSSNSSARPSKKRKVIEVPEDTMETKNGGLDDSFSSFSTGDVLSDLSDQYVCQDTPKHFNNLTDKPVITDPQSRSLTEPKKKTSVHPRRSLHAMKLEAHLSSGPENNALTISSTDLSSEESDSVFNDSMDSDKYSRHSLRRAAAQTPNDFDLSDVAGLKKLLDNSKDSESSGATQATEAPDENDGTNVPNLRIVNSPKNDLTDVGVKKLFTTPKQTKSPKNDLRDIPNLRKLMSPMKETTPLNDLSDVIGVNKLLSTPKPYKSPKNDLRNIPNLRRLMSPKRQNSPRNDLTSVSGVKKLLSLPKVQNSPLNDLTKIPNLKRIMSPKKQNSPKNDLTKIPNLRRIMSPKQQNSPKNDLTNIHSLRNMMTTPRPIREPLNDLSDVEGVANIFNVSVESQSSNNQSDIENNEDLFDKLFTKKPLKTYRGKSMSPVNKNKLNSSVSYKRKTQGDVPHTSPRVEKWLKDQAVIRLQRIDNLQGNKTLEETRTPKGRKRKVGTDREVASDKQLTRSKRAATKQISGTPTNQKDERFSDPESGIKSSKKTTRLNRRGKTREQTSISEENKDVESNEVDSTVIDSPCVSRPLRRGKKILETKNLADQTAEVHSTTEETKCPTPKQGKGRRINNVDENTCADAVVMMPPLKRRGRPRKKSRQEEKVDATESVFESEDSILPKNIKGKKITVPAERDNINEDTPPKRGRGRKVVRKAEQNTTNSYESSVDVNEISDSNEDSVKTTTSKRTGKRKLASNLNDIAISTVTPEPVKRNGRTKKVVIDEESKIEDVSKTTRGRRVVIQEKPDNEEANNSVDVEKKPERVTRTTRRKNVVILDESEEDDSTSIESKNTSRGRKYAGNNQKADDETSTSTSKRTKQQATKKRTKAKAIEEVLVAVDSPRTTRSKKGNFNKYGSDFLIDKGDGRTDNKGMKSSPDKKLQEKNIPKTNDTEETLRRSKRTRK